MHLYVKPAAAQPLRKLVAAYVSVQEENGCGYAAVFSHLNASSIRCAGSS